MALLRTYQVMLPRLQAEEQLAHIQVTRVAAAASLEFKDAERQQHDLAMVAKIERAPRKAPKASIAQLEAMGIAVHVQSAEA